MKVKYGDIVVARFGNGKEIEGEIMGIHSTTPTSTFWITVRVINSKNIEPKDIAVDVVDLKDIVRIKVKPEKVEFT